MLPLHKPPTPLNLGNSPALAKNGFGSVSYTSGTLSQSLTASTPWTLAFAAAAINNALQGEFDANFWNGSILTPINDNDVYLLKITITAETSGGGVLVCDVGPSTTVFTNEQVGTFHAGTSVPQVFTFVFPILISADFSLAGGNIVLTASVNATVIGASISITPISSGIQP